MSQQAPVNGTAYTFYVSLEDAATAGKFKAAPTLATGDFKISKDGGAFANLATLPTVTPAAGIAVKIALSATEMTADQVVVTCIDAAGAEWNDLTITIQPQTVAPDAAYNRLGAPAGASVSADIATIDTVADRIEVDTQDIQSRLPAALVAGRMSSDAVAISGSTAAADAVEANIGNLDDAITDAVAAPAAALTAYDPPTRTEATADKDAILTILGTPADTDIATDIANISAGGGLDAAGVRAAIGMASADLDTQLDGIAAKTDLITNDTPITIASPVATNGDITIYRGDDYTGAEIEIPLPTSPDLTGATLVQFKTRGTAKTLTVTGAGTSSQAGRLTFTAAETEAYATRSIPYEIDADLASGAHKTLRTGSLIVRPGLAGGA